MVSLHGQPPFSIASRLSDPSILQRPGQPPAGSARLLAVEPSERNGIVVLGMTVSVHQHAQGPGFTELLISGVSERAEGKNPANGFIVSCKGRSGSICLQLLFAW